MGLIPEIVCGDDHDTTHRHLTTLCTAVLAVPGLAETLSKEDLMYTVFAPNDEAWGNLMLIHDNLLEDTDKLANILLNHVVVGFNPICAEDLRCGNLLFMANGSERGQRTKTACSYTEAHLRVMMLLVNQVKNLPKYTRRVMVMEAVKVTCLKLLVRTLVLKME